MVDSCGTTNPPVRGATRTCSAASTPTRGVRGPLLGRDIRTGSRLYDGRGGQRGIDTSGWRISRRFRGSTTARSCSSRSRQLVSPTPWYEPSIGTSCSWSSVVEVLEVADCARNEAPGTRSILNDRSS